MSGLFRVLYLLQIPRAILHILTLKISPMREIIGKDIARWIKETNSPEFFKDHEWKGFVWLLWRQPAYRNLFYYRITREERIGSRILIEIAKIFFKPMDTLFIYTPDVGAGLFIQHGFSTIISAKSIGQNCWINQQVTIGYSNSTDSPIIGDNVIITAGAKVFGGITIGENSVIGANAVVTKDVPPNCTVVGVPAYIIKCNGVAERRPL